MSQITGVSPRFLCLLLIVVKQGVQFIHHRRDFIWHRFDHPALLAGPHRRNGNANLAQRPQTVKRLQRRHADQSQREDQETVDQDRANIGDLGIETIAALPNLKQPFCIGVRQDNRPLE